MPDNPFRQPMAQPQTNPFVAATTAAVRPSGGSLSLLNDVARQAAHGVTFGWADEIAARMDALTGLGDPGTYEENLAAQRARSETFQQERPGLAAGAEITGAVVSPVTKVLPFGGATRGAAALRGAGSGAAGGALYGAGAAEEDRGGDALKGALIGSVLGGGIGAATKGLGSKKVPAPTTEALRAQADRAYQAADRGGVIIRRESFENFAKGLQRRMAEEGIDATLQPGALAALRRVTDTGENLTLRGAEILRRVIGNAAGSQNPSERRLAMIMKDSLDDYITRLSPRDLLSGAPGAVQRLREARGLWSRVRKSEAIEEIVERARDQAGANYTTAGFANALRQQLRQLKNNRRRWAQFDPSEQRMITRIIRGDMPTNVARLIGRFSVRGPVSSIPATLAASTVGGMTDPVTGAIIGAGVAGVGEVGRRTSAALTSRAVNRLGEQVRRAAPARIPGRLSTYEDALARALFAGQTARNQNATR